MIQEVLALGIVTLAIGYVGYIVFRRIFRKGTKKNEVMTGCMGCPGANACVLKELKTASEKKKEGCAKPERLD